MTTKIIDVKAVGFCSKHQQKDIDVLKYKDGTIIPDKDIDCVECK